jgi:hypothetical protein
MLIYNYLEGRTGINQYIQRKRQLIPFAALHTGGDKANRRRLVVN